MSVSSKQATAEQSISAQQSLILVRNLLRTAISSISYIRHLFPEDCFQDRLLSGLNVKTLLPTTNETKLIINWLEHGVFDALEKKYLRSLVFGMYFDPSNESTLIEAYTFKISYDQEEYNLDITRSKKEYQQTQKLMTKDGIKQSTIAMIRTLISLAQTLTPIPKSRYLVMKLFYYDERTPMDYEPQFFRPASDEPPPSFHFKPLRLNLGGVTTPYHDMCLQIKTTIDCVDSLKDAWIEGKSKPRHPMSELFERGTAEKEKEAVQEQREQEKENNDLDENVQENNELKQKLEKEEQFSSEEEEEEEEEIKVKKRTLKQRYNENENKENKKSREKDEQKPSTKNDNEIISNEKMRKNTTSKRMKLSIEKEGDQEIDEKSGEPEDESTSASETDEKEYEKPPLKSNNKIRRTSSRENPMLFSPSFLAKTSEFISTYPFLTLPQLKRITTMKKNAAEALVKEMQKKGILGTNTEKGYPVLIHKDPTNDLQAKGKDELKEQSNKKQIVDDEKDSERFKHSVKEDESQEKETEIHNLPTKDVEKGKPNQKSRPALDKDSEQKATENDINNHLEAEGIYPGSAVASPDLMNLSSSAVSSSLQSSEHLSDQNSSTDSSLMSQPEDLTQFSSLQTQPSLLSPSLHSQPYALSPTSIVDSQFTHSRSNTFGYPSSSYSAIPSANSSSKFATSDLSSSIAPSVSLSASRLFSTIEAQNSAISNPLAARQAASIMASLSSRAMNGARDFRGASSNYSTHINSTASEASFLDKRRDEFSGSDESGAMNTVEEDAKLSKKQMIQNQKITSNGGDSSLLASSSSLLNQISVAENSLAADSQIPSESSESQNSRHSSKRRSSKHNKCSIVKDPLKQGQSPMTHSKLRDQEKDEGSTLGEENDASPTSLSPDVESNIQNKDIQANSEIKAASVSFEASSELSDKQQHSVTKKNRFSRGKKAKVGEE